MVPAVAIAEAGIAAVSCFPVTKVVVWLVPLNLTTALLLKLLPLTVNVKAGSPAFALSGESSVMAGTTPGCGVGVLEGDPYPHAKDSIVSHSASNIFMTPSQLCPFSLA